MCATQTHNNNQKKELYRTIWRTTIDEQKKKENHTQKKKRHNQRNYDWFDRLNAELGVFEPYSKMLPRYNVWTLFTSFIELVLRLFFFFLSKMRIFFNFSIWMSHNVKWFKYGDRFFSFQKTKRKKQTDETKHFQNNK